MLNSICHLVQIHLLGILNSGFAYYLNALQQDLLVSELKRMLKYTSKTILHSKVELHLLKNNNLFVWGALNF